MELLLAFTLSALVVVAGVLFTTRFLKTKSYEEVIEEQRRGDLLIKSGRRKKTATKRRKPAAGRVVKQSSSRHDNKEGGSAQEINGGGRHINEEDDDDDGERNDGGDLRKEGLNLIETTGIQITGEESTPTGEVVKKEKRKKRVEISDRESSVEEHHSPARCALLHRRDSYSSILTNRTEVSPVQQPNQVEELNHFDLTRPASDDVLIKYKRRRSSQPTVLLLVDSSSGERQSPSHGNNNTNSETNQTKSSPGQRPNLATLLSSSTLSPDEVSELVDILLSKGSCQGGQSSGVGHRHGNGDLIKQLRENVASAEENVQQLTSKLSSTRQELARQRESSKLAGGYKTELDTTKRELSTERGKVNNLTTSLRDRDQAYNMQAQQMQANQSRIVQECSATRAANSNLEQQLSLSFKSNQEQSSRIQSMKRDGQLIEENYNKKYEDLKTRLELDYREKEAHLREEYGKSKSDYEERLDKQRSDLINRVNTLSSREAEVGDLKELLITREEEVVDLKERLQHGVKDNRILEEELESKRLELSLKNSKLTELRSDNQRLLSMISIIEGELLIKRGELTSIRSLVEDTDDSMPTIELIKSKLSCYGSEIVNYKSVLAETDQLLSKLEESAVLEEGRWAERVSLLEAELSLKLEEGGCHEED